MTLEGRTSREPASNDVEDSAGEDARRSIVKNEVSQAT